MAVVYEAEQISLGRRVALKVLPFAAAMPAIVPQNAEAANSASPLARRLADYALGLRYEDLGGFAIRLGKLGGKAKRAGQSQRD